MTESYQDPWITYKAVFESTKKKFLKKPNYSQTLAEYISLSLRFEDEECERYAALCHMQIASIYEILNDWSRQYTHLLKAARLFSKAETRDHDMCTAICSDGLNEIQDCYNKASNLILEQNGTWLAGLHQMELGNILYRLEHPSVALKYLSRGTRLLEVEHFSHLAALKRLAECQVELELFVDAISSVDQLWTTHMKSAANPSFGYGKELLKDCEILCVLLLIRSKDLMLPNEISPRHRHLLAMYDDADCNKKSGMDLHLDQFPLKDSSLSRDQFVCLYDFITALRKSDLEIAKKSFMEMKKFMNNICAKIASDLITLVRSGQQF